MPVEQPTRFELIEIYRTSEAAAAHKATAHYAAWRDAVATLMAEPAPSTADAFAQFVRTEHAKYEAIVKASGAKAD